MDGMGAAASVLQIVEIASKGPELCRRFKNAPREMEISSSHVERLSASLELLRKVEKELNSPDILHDKACRMLEKPITEALQALTTIQTLLPKSIANASARRSRLRWVTRDRTTTKQIMRDLVQIETSLALQVELAQWYSLVTTI